MENVTTRIAMLSGSARVWTSKAVAPGAMKRRGGLLSIWIPCFRQTADVLYRLHRPIQKSLACETQRKRFVIGASRGRDGDGQDPTLDHKNVVHPVNAMAAATDFKVLGRDALGVFGETQRKKDLPRIEGCCRSKMGRHSSDKTELHIERPRAAQGGLEEIARLVDKTIRPQIRQRQRDLVFLVVRKTGGTQIQTDCDLVPVGMRCDVGHRESHGELCDHEIPWS